MTERNLYRRDYSHEEAELNAHNEDMEIENTQPANFEEESFKKRYSDLRRHLQRIQDEHKEKEKELKKQIEAASSQNMILPKTLEEFEDWRKQYPKVSGIIDTAIRLEVEKLGKKLDEIEQTNKQEKIRNQKERAMIELAKLHPDFYNSVDGRPPILEQKEFHEWIEEQEFNGVNQARQALYENETNAQLAAKWITLFKTETNYYSKSKPKKGNSTPEAAYSVRGGGSGSTPRSGNTAYEFSESQIDKMSEREYAANEEAIENARRKGKILYDLSGAAR
jgi:hypothetical protein